MSSGHRSSHISTTCSLKVAFPRPEVTLWKALYLIHLDFPFRAYPSLPAFLLLKPNSHKPHQQTMPGTQKLNKTNNQIGPKKKESSSLDPIQFCSLHLSSYKWKVATGSWGKGKGLGRLHHRSASCHALRFWPLRSDLSEHAVAILSHS